MDDFNELIAAAKSVGAPRELSPTASCGAVGAALETVDGEVFLGVSVDLASSIGFCAEHAAAAAMLTAGRSQVARMVAVGRSGDVLPPCGRCREFIAQLNPANRATLAMVTSTAATTIDQLLPFH